MRYRAILFDADETLFDFEVAECAAISQLLLELGIDDPDGPARYHQINAACWRDFERGVITQKELKTRRFSEFLRKYEGSFDVSETAGQYEIALSRQAHLLPGAYETVKRIANVLPVAIVTNGIARVQRGRMERSPLKELISALVISEEVGAAKPDPAMVFAALRALGGIPPEDALLVGDSLTSDMRAAARAGVDACWFNPHGRERPADLPIRYEIHSIEDAVNIALQ